MEQAYVRGVECRSLLSANHHGPNCDVGCTRGTTEHTVCGRHCRFDDNQPSTYGTNFLGVRFPRSFLWRSTSWRPLDTWEPKVSRKSSASRMLSISRAILNASSDSLIRDIGIWNDFIGHFMSARIQAKNTMNTAGGGGARSFVLGFSATSSVF